MERAARRSTRAPRRDPRRRAHDRRRRRTRATRISTAPASTSRSRASRPQTSATRTTAPCGTPGQRAVLAAGGALSHHHGVGLNRARFVREALGAGFDVLQSVKDALDPNGILNPGKLGLRSPFGDVARGREPSATTVLVVDVGTSSVRASVFDAAGATITASSEELLPDSPADGLVRVRRAPRWPRPASSSRRRALDEAGPVDGIGISNQRGSTIVWDRATGEPVGPGIGWQDLRTVGACLALRDEGCASARTSRRPSCNGSSTSSPTAARARDLCFGTVDTWVAWTLSERRGARHRRDQRGDHRHAGDRQARRPGTRAMLDVLDVPAAMLPDDRRLVPRRRGRDARCRARRRSPRCSATSRRRWSGRAACAPGDAKITFGTGGMLDVVLGDRRAARSTGAGKAGTFPIVAWRHDGRITWGVEAIMLAAGTNVQWLRDDLGLIATSDESHDVAAQCADTGGVVYVPGAARARNPGVGLRRARRAVRAHARHRPRRDRARGARRHRAPRRRSRRRGGGRQRHRHPGAARRRRHDRQPHVRAGARRRHATAGRDLSRCAKRPRAAPPSWPASRSGITATSTISRRRGRRGRRVEPNGALDRDRWRDARRAGREAGSPSCQESISDTACARRARRRARVTASEAGRPPRHLRRATTSRARSGRPGVSEHDHTVDRVARPRPCRPTRRPSCVPSRVVIAPTPSTRSRTPTRRSSAFATGCAALLPNSSTPDETREQRAWSGR